MELMLTCVVKFKTVAREKYRFMVRILFEVLVTKMT